MNEKEQIEDLIKTKPKHYAKMVKNNAFLWNWVQTHSSTLDEGVPAQIYSAITGTSGACPNGSQYKLKSAIDGWVGCGKAATCKCVRDATSAAVSTAKSSYTTEEKAATNKKRAKTNLRKYGVKNVGQSTKAKENHALFYSDNEKVRQQVAKQEATMTEKYGVTNAAHLELVVEQKKKTNVERYGVENPMQNKEIAAKSGASRSEVWDPTELLKRNYKRFLEKCDRLWRIKPLISEADFKGTCDTAYLDWECLECGHTFNRRFHWGRPPLCRVCNPPEVKFESHEEVSLREFLSSVYDGPIVIRDRSIINPYELDMVLPDKGIAIDYGGLYWHSEKACEDRGRPKKWNYHETKMKLAEAAGLRLITIFSDEWLTKRTLVESSLKSILGLDKNKIGARECQVSRISRESAVAFHNLYHLQGAALRSPINYGLFYESELVAAVSFVADKDGHYLTRYSTSLRVVGGCTKLIKFHTSAENTRHITTFADLRWSQGQMYCAMGFYEVSRVPPTHDYVGNHYSQRYDSRTFPKSVSSDSHGTNQWERLRELGYDRIWDCGKIKFRLDVNPENGVQSPVDLFLW
jgi:rubrerythrin